MWSQFPLSILSVLLFRFLKILFFFYFLIYKNKFCILILVKKYWYSLQTNSYEWSALLFFCNVFIHPERNGFYSRQFVEWMAIVGSGELCREKVTSLMCGIEWQTHETLFSISSQVCFSDSHLSLSLSFSFATFSSIRLSKFTSNAFTQDSGKSSSFFQQMAIKASDSLLACLLALYIRDIMQRATCAELNLCFW